MGPGLLEIVAAGPSEPLGIEALYMKFFVDTGLLDGVTTIL
jgi:hypothetical protein